MPNFTKASEQQFDCFGLYTPVKEVDVMSA